MKTKRGHERRRRYLLLEHDLILQEEERQARSEKLEKAREDNGKNEIRSKDIFKLLPTRSEDLESITGPISRDTILATIFGQLDKLIIESECEVVLDTAQLFLVSDYSDLSIACLHWLLSLGTDSELITDPKLRLYIFAVAFELLGKNIESAPLPSGTSSMLRL